MGGEWSCYFIDFIDRKPTSEITKTSSIFKIRQMTSIGLADTTENNVWQMENSFIACTAM